MYVSMGRLSYSNQSPDIYRLVVDVDKELADYYFKLIPRYIDCQKPMWPAHITICRPHVEVPVNLGAWGKYEGEQIEFYYTGILEYNEKYIWLDTLSLRLEEIRSELGLTIIPHFRTPPSPFTKYFHCSVANFKNSPPTEVKYNKEPEP